MKELEWPFDADYILSRKRKLKKELLNSGQKFLEKRVAILGGSTTSDLRQILELFLLNYGIKPEFYESEYNQYYQDAMFPNQEIEAFKPDIIYIHTSNRNITSYPMLTDSVETINNMLKSEIQKFAEMWNRLSSVYSCPIIQNNFEYPHYRLMGNQDAVLAHGKVNFISKLNTGFYEYAQSHQNFFINDINYLSSCYGLDKWSEPFYWHMYKYSCCVSAIPELAFNISKIIKSIYGKNKKGFVLDMDNTLWGGIIGDDGVDNIILGQETPLGQVYSEFQAYIKEHKQLGVILNINSKNELDNALSGLTHPDSTLKKEDFIVIKANWEQKDKNLNEIADKLNLLPESLVFVDDNPAERAIVKEQLPNVSVPEISTVEHYVSILDKSGFFEVTNLSKDDLKRNEMYKENAQRESYQSKFENYEDYLLSLKMKATIAPFESIYMARIAQLTNKSNQFNLTTKRYTQSEIEDVAANPDYITLYGKLEDRFGDNGIVSVVIGHKVQNVLNIDLWLMSCRVLKRDMEFAMMDALVKIALEQGITKIKGYYYPTSKNNMVKDFYKIQGFNKDNEDENGNTEWSLSIDNSYKNKNKVIENGDLKWKEMEFSKN